MTERPNSVSLGGGDPAIKAYCDHNALRVDFGILKGFDQGRALYGLIPVKTETFREL